MDRARESAVWRIVKNGAPGLWQRLENSIATGWPDTVYLTPDKSVGWVELKDLPKFKVTLGLRADQRLWLRRWCRNGGEAWVLARYKERFLFVRGSDILNSGNVEEWTAAATAVWIGAIDWPHFTQLISKNQSCASSR